MFESRLFFVDKLVGDGSSHHPLRSASSGRDRSCAALRPEAREPDIRAGMAMVIAALCAEGTSTIGNIGQIDQSLGTDRRAAPGAGGGHRAGRSLLTRTASARRSRSGPRGREPDLHGSRRPGSPTAATRRGRTGAAEARDRPPTSPRPRWMRREPRSEPRYILSPGSVVSGSSRRTRRSRWSCFEASGNHRRVECGSHLDEGGRSTHRPRRSVPARARRRGRADDPRAPLRGTGLPARPRGDLQGPRREPSTTHDERSRSMSRQGR